MSAPVSTEKRPRLLEHADELDALLTRSHQRPVVIFKHSRACGTSAEAYDSLEPLLTGDPSAEFYVLDVLRNRAVSQAVAAAFGVRHESPQALVVRNGRVAWHGSHFRVTADAVRKALVPAD